MRRKITIAMAMLSLAVATQAQDRMKVATGRVLTKAEIGVDSPRKEIDSKLGIELQRLLATDRTQVVDKKDGKNAVKEQPTVNVMVMLAPSAGVTAEMLESAGCKVHWSMKSQAFVSAPVDRLDEISNINGVLSINLPEKYQLQNNIAREATNVSLVADPLSAEREGLPQAYDGSGVIVGVVDTGIDFAHPAFRNADGTTRIKRAFTYRRTDEIQPEESESDWKNTYTDPEEILNVPSVTGTTHGSHTMGIAAGSNTGNNLQGMAPGADLVPADLIEIYDNYLVSGLKSICDYAQEVGKPVVTNYSLGAPGYFRDGCHPVSQAITELTEDGTKPGVIFSFSAGNDGYGNCYVHHTFSSDDEKLYVMMNIPSDIEEVKTKDGLVNTHPLHKAEWLAAYASKNVDNAEEMVVAYSLSEKRILDLEEKIGFATLHKEWTGTEYKNYLTPSQKTESSGLYRISLNQLLTMLADDKYYRQVVHNCCDGVTRKRGQIFQTTKDMKILLFEDVRLGGCFSMPAGTHLSVLHYPNNSPGKLIKPEGFDFVREGTPDGSINESACNIANITVGSYTVRNTFTSYFGDKTTSKQQMGEVTDFTSYGYTNDGNNLPKPDVLAPGSYLLSAVNGNYAPYFETYGNLLPKYKMANSKTLAQNIEYDGNNYWYEYMQGTSMAAPVVTGIIALWLQADPALSVRDIYNVLEHSSVPYLGNNPVQSSRFGKIDALAGLKYIVNNMTGIDNITYPQTTNTPDNRIFTLDGRELKGTPSAGIYVSGGRKVVYRK